MKLMRDELRVHADIVTEEVVDLIAQVMEDACSGCLTGKARPLSIAATSSSLPGVCLNKFIYFTQFQLSSKFSRKDKLT